MENVQAARLGGGLSVAPSESLLGLKLTGAAQTISSGAVGPELEWNEQVNDPMGMWDVGEPTRIIVPSDGWYLFTARVRWEGNSTGYRGTFFKVNGAAASNAGHDQSPSVAVAWWQTVSYFDKLEAGDYVEVAVRQTSGGDLDVQKEAETTPYVTASRVPVTSGLSLTSSAAVTIADGSAWKSCPLDTAEIDVDGMFDSGAEDRITCQRAGVYILSTQYRWQGNATGWRGVTLRLNEEATQGHLGGSTEAPQNAAVWHQQFLTAWHLEVDDVIQLLARQTSGGNLQLQQVSGMSPYLRAARIGA